MRSCLSVYMKNNMCCYHEVTLGSKETKERVEKPVTDSGYYYTQSHKSSTGENERDTLSCTINIDIRWFCKGVFRVFKEC